ncbi:MAG: hypothetical protein H0T53_11945 [Herpetosiphonaceae bacterium]|nr:hypothetical protein [Herpetosiphonaceae bacterium]
MKHEEFPRGADCAGRLFDKSVLKHQYIYRYEKVYFKSGYFVNSQRGYGSARLLKRESRAETVALWFYNLATYVAFYSSNQEKYRGNK